MTMYEILADTGYRDGHTVYHRKAGEVVPIGDPAVVQTLLVAGKIAPAHPAAAPPPVPLSEPKAEPMPAAPAPEEVVAADLPRHSIEIMGESTTPPPPSAKAKSRRKPRRKR